MIYQVLNRKAKDKEILLPYMRTYRLLPPRGCLKASAGSGPALLILILRGPRAVYQY